MEVLEKLSERLRDLMVEAGINIPQLAAAIDIDQSAISRIVSNERMPSTETLVRIGDYFHCSLNYLLNRTEILDERIYKQRPPFSEQINILLKRYHYSKYRLRKEINLSEDTITRWQKGINQPTVESLIRLANKFGCTVDEIVGRE